MFIYVQDLFQGDVGDLHLKRRVKDHGPKQAAGAYVSVWKGECMGQRFA